MIEIRDLAVEPKVDAGDGRVLEVGDLLTKRAALVPHWQDRLQGIEGKREDKIVKSLFSSLFAAQANPDLRGVSDEALHGTTKMQCSAMRANVIAGGVVQVGERQSGYAHLAR